MPLAPGDDAPAFEVTSSDGKPLNLADFRGRKNVVLYFYPRDFTMVCTRETCGFRDMYEDLASQDTEVIGVSFDDDATHESFRKEHHVPFPLVADTQHALAEAYGATSSTIGKLLGRASRVTYLIDKGGKIAGIFKAELSAKTHVDGIREALQRLQTG
jgi:thioredoxin-dependent peroxiredoxin